MKIKNLAILALLAVSFLGQKSQAYSGGGSHSGWRLPLSFMYIIDNTKSGSSTSNTNRLLATATLGYVFSSSPLFIGALYDYDDISSNNASSRRTISGYGATVGIVTDHLFLFANYIASADYKVDSPYTGYSQGSGFGARLGYLFDVGSNISMGPELSYRSIKWTKTTTGATADFQYDTMVPYVTAHFTF